MAFPHLQDLGDVMEPENAPEKSCTYLYVHPSLREVSAPKRGREPPGSAASRPEGSRWERLIATVLADNKPS